MALIVEAKLRQVGKADRRSTTTIISPSKCNLLHSTHLLAGQLPCFSEGVRTSYLE